MYIYGDIMITQNDIGAVDSRMESLSCRTNDYEFWYLLIIPLALSMEAYERRLVG